MRLNREILRQLILEALTEQGVPMYLRGQGSPEAFSSGIFEEDAQDESAVDEQEIPLGYGSQSSRRKRRAAGIAGDEEAFGESSTAGDKNH